MDCSDYQALFCDPKRITKQGLLFCKFSQEMTFLGMRSQRDRPEHKIQLDLIEFLENREWMVEATHGNAYQKGFPDLYSAHVRHGQRWIDCKVEGKYSFTKAQIAKWPAFEAKGVGIWILTGANEAQYDRLFRPPNMRDYWKARYGELTDIDQLLRDLNATPDQEE